MHRHHQCKPLIRVPPVSVGSKNQMTRDEDGARTLSAPEWIATSVIETVVMNGAGL